MNNDPLPELAMWKAWQEKVKASLPNFCADTIYVEQMSPPESEFKEVLESLGERIKADPVAQVRDYQYGARVVDIPGFGPVTRMWLDAQVEIDFLRRGGPKEWMLGNPKPSVFEIGGGYGRLAVELAPLIGEYLMVDPVPISVQLARVYTQRHAARDPLNIMVANISQYRELKPELVGQFDLAINIHSWNECSIQNIAAWVNELRGLKVSYLFTVSHGSTVQPARGPEYRAWGRGNWKDLLLSSSWELVAEENIGLGKHPHALWRRL